MQNLKRREIGIWIWNLSDPWPGYCEPGDILSWDELKRAGLFSNKPDQNRFVACRAGMRSILGGILGKNPGWLRFEYSENGKPSLACQSGKEGLRFNLSHSGDQALLVAAYGLELGADLEHEQDGLETVDIAGLALSKIELEWMKGTPESERHGAFYEIWTLKEAVLKSKSLGLASGLTAFHVLPDGCGSAEVLPTDDGPAESWRAYSFSPAPGLHAAVAYVHPGGAEFQMAPQLKMDYPYSGSIFEGGKANVELSLHL